MWQHCVRHIYMLYGPELVARWEGRSWSCLFLSLLINGEQFLQNRKQDHSDLYYIGDCTSSDFGRAG